MLTLKELHEISKKHVAGMIDGQVIDFRLEQAEQVQGKWEVVISFLLHNVNQPEPVSGILGLTSKNPPYERVFKKLVLNQEGELSKFLMHNGK